MNGLRALFMRYEPSAEGIQADILLIEPSGEEHQVRCLCRPNGSMDLGELGGGGRLRFLESRYGSQVIWALTRQLTLGT